MVLTLNRNGLIEFWSSVGLEGRHGWVDLTVAGLHTHPKLLFIFKCVGDFEVHLSTPAIVARYDPMASE